MPLNGAHAAIATQNNSTLSTLQKIKGNFNPLTGEAVISRLGGVLVFKNSL